MTGTFEEFKAYLAEMANLEQAVRLFMWDMNTGMPKNGFAAHSDAMTYFSTRQFAMSTSPELKRLLDALSEPEEFEQLDDMYKFVVIKMKDDYEKDARVPADFYEEYVRVRSESENVWKVAKNTNDWNLFKPYLEKVIENQRIITEYRHPGEDVYDAMLSEFELGMDSETYDRVFEEFKAGVIPLIRKILQAEQPDDSKFAGYYDIDAQRKVQKLLLEYDGFDFARGAMGETEHPFTLDFTSQDVRVTNHYHEDYAIGPMFTAIHEGGHAIFGQNTDPKFDGTVAASCQYMGIHESQSRFYENILGRNPNYWVPIYPKIQELLPTLKNVSLDEFTREINHVRNSYIRTEADEVTYGLHIIVRYEIEKAIYRDGVSVDELPALWNQKMQEYLGITPPTDTLGILQDTHWSGGEFGYFPSYLLGTIYDGMFKDAVEKDLGPIDDILREGGILEITRWLNVKIHKYGNTRTPREVLDAVCGMQVTAEPIIRHFTEKYTKIYNLG